LARRYGSAGGEARVEILYGVGLMLVVVVLLGGLQSLGETRVGWIFPIISVLAVLVFLARCMFVAPAHH
jgi:hypothetical protein